MSGMKHHLTEQRRRPLRLPVGAIVIVAGPLLGGLPADALAQQWLVTPEVEIAVENIDNPRLFEGDVDTNNVTGGLLGLAAELRRNTEISSLLLRPAARINRYSGDDNLDSEAFYMTLGANTERQRSEWRFTGNFSREQVFTGETTPSEIDETDVDDSVQTGTGRTSERRERDLWRLRPGFSFDLTQRTELKFDVNFIDVRYDTQAFGEAIDYRDSQINAGIVRALSPDSNLEFGVFASQYEPDDVDRETDSTGARVRYNKEVSDLSTFYVDVGASESNVPSRVTPGAEVTESAFLWNVGYSRQLERTRWRFSVGQNVTPSGSGFLVERDMYRVGMTHQLRPRWSMSLSGVVLNSDSLADEGIVTSNDRDYMRGRASLAYDLTQKWSMEGSYTFTHQDFADEPGDAQEHAFRLSLIYRPPTPTR